MQRESVSVDSDDWRDAGVFEEFWKQGLSAYDQMEGIDWSWISMDATMTKAPLKETLASLQADRPSEPLGYPGGYDYHEVRGVVQEFGFTAHIRSRREQARAIRQEAGFRARRWVVERTHSWMNRFRRIMLHLACALITWRAVGLSK